MDASVVSLCLVMAAAAQSNYHGMPSAQELGYQRQVFKQWWGEEFATRLEDLPTEGRVPEFRTPYAGHDYPDNRGGTTAAMSKYDRAFHGYRMLATSWERRDIEAHRAAGGAPTRGLFGSIRTRNVPTWYGHCNGWTAAAIRHAEPQRSVVRNGVVFTPADIKGMLAELYMYSETEFLGGIDAACNPAILHLVLANWMGRGSHPLGVESAVGEVVVNYPAFAYRSTIRPMAARRMDVRTVVTYAVNTPREYDRGPQNYWRQWHFHYMLDLDAEGNIAAGRYFGDSNRIDMLWTPLAPTQGGTEGNRRGNPYLNVKEVLAIWRDSVPEDLRNRWMNVDPTEEDRILTPEEEAAPGTVTDVERERQRRNSEGAGEPVSVPSLAG